jgi:hypothetical protein
MPEPHGDSIIQTPQFISDGISMWRPLTLLFSKCHLRKNRLIMMRIPDTIHEPDILRISRTWIGGRNLPPIVVRLWTPWPILNRIVSNCRLQSSGGMECIPRISMVIIQIRWPKLIGRHTIWPCSSHVVSRLLLWVGHGVRLWVSVPKG